MDAADRAQSLPTLTRANASSFARLALKGAKKEYPNKPGHVLLNDADAKTPRALHPAFYGCYDWHSAVHGHWMLAHLLKKFPGPAGGEGDPRRAELTPDGGRTSGPRSNTSTARRRSRSSGPTAGRGS